MTLFSQIVLLAASLPFGSLVLGQTIKIGGKEVEANKSNVAPASEVLDDELQLTDAVLSNLTTIGLTYVDSFRFGDASSSSAVRCKVMPGDTEWPSGDAWNVLDIVTGGALIKTVPIGSVCYEGEHYNKDECAKLLETWSSSDAHDEDSTSNMSPLFDGSGCLPQNAGKGQCRLGGVPEYSVKATDASQVQLAVNFARSHNVRLVIRNTGHDFLGKSTGAGSLNIWTHHLKNLEFLEDYEAPGAWYKGPAFKIGAGTQVFELYEAADKYGYTGVGGECRTVGVAGGYTAMGGHSPMTPIAGLGSDQVLSIDIVTPDGRFVTASKTENEDLFWAVRGGGGAAFGVVTSMIVRVWPKMIFSGATWLLSTAQANMTEETFWKGMRMYWQRLPEYSDNHTYGYSLIANEGTNRTWHMRPWLVPGMELDEFKAMLAPLFKEWESIGFRVEPTFFSHDNFYETWKKHFPLEFIGRSGVRSGSRLIPRKNWDDAETLNKTMDAVQSIVQDGSVLVQYNLNGAAPEGVPDSALNPAWRESTLFAIVVARWNADELSPDAILAINKKITQDWMQRLRDVSPGAGGYGNEGDVMEPDFGQAFYGGENYKRLSALKRKLDPWGVFYAPTSVGSEDWGIEQMPEIVDGLFYSDTMKRLGTWLTLQTGRLCRKA